MRDLSLFGVQLVLGAHMLLPLGGYLFFKKQKAYVLMLHVNVS